MNTGEGKGEVIAKCLELVQRPEVKRREKDVRYGRKEGDKRKARGRNMGEAGQDVLERGRHNRVMGDSEYGGAADERKEGNRTSKR